MNVEFLTDQLYLLKSGQSRFELS